MPSLKTLTLSAAEASPTVGADIVSQQDQFVLPRWRYLRTDGPLNRLPLLCSSNNVKTLPNIGEGQGAGFDEGTAPLVKSKLKTMRLRGPWVMLEHDLIEVLTIYTPNLNSLEVDRIHAVSKTTERPEHGHRFLRAVLHAVRSGVSGGNGDGTDTRHRLRLKEVTSVYSVGPDIARGVSVRHISRSEFKKQQNQFEGGLLFKFYDSVCLQDESQQ
ncbi:hypothetical protein BGZ74_008212 [Mortierella antarctica]|nr:hypothetical protein BGZ74_008212 [Mortierella antarctica]